MVGTNCINYSSFTHILIMLFSNMASAQNIPPKIVGIWSEQSCSAKGKFIVLNADSVLIFDTQTDPDTVIFAPAELTGDTLAISRPGSFMILPETAAMTRCDALPPELYAAFGEAIALFRGWDAVIRQCRSGSARSCADTAFALVDVSRDRKLSRAEIARLLRGIGFFIGYELIVETRENSGDSQLASKRLAVDTTKLYGVAALASLTGPTVSGNLLASYDYDGDGFLSIDELLQDRGPKALSSLLGTAQAGATQIALQQLLSLTTAMVGQLPGILGKVLFP